MIPAIIYRIPSSRKCVVGIILALDLLGRFCGPAGAVDCKDGGATQTDMNECAFLGFKKVDSELNAKYAKLSACAGPSTPSGKILLDAQRAWLKFRDAECRFQSSGSEGGSVQPMLVSICMKVITGDRNKQLDSYLSCEEGDLSCPVHGCSTVTKPVPR